MNKLFFLHTHFIPEELISNDIGSVLVPEFYPDLVNEYYKDVCYFRDLNSYFEYMEKKKIYNCELFYSIENINMLKSIKDIYQYLKNGLTMIQLFNGRSNKYYTIENGLTNDGYELLRVIEEHNLLLDLSHLSDDQIQDIFNFYSGRMVVSHCSCRDIMIDSKNRSNSLSIKMIKELGKQGTVFGIAFLNDIVTSELHSEKENDDTIIEDLVEQICCFVDLVGVSKVALGPDFICTNYFSKVFNTKLHIPSSLYRCNGYETLKTKLMNKGISSDSVDSIFYSNAYNLIKNRI